LLIAGTASATPLAFEIPEPATAVLLAVAAVCLIGLALRRRRTAMIATLVAASAAPALARDFVVDQSYEPAANFISISRVTPEGGYGFAFTPTVPELDVVDLLLSGFDPRMTLNIRAGEITGPIVGTSLRGLQLAETRRFGQVVQFDFASPLALVPGDVYYLEPIASVPGTGAGLVADFFRTGSTYASGYLYRTSFEYVGAGPNLGPNFLPSALAGQNAWTSPYGYAGGPSVSTLQPRTGTQAVGIAGSGLAPVGGLVAAGVMRDSNFDPIASGNPIVTMQASVRLDGPSTDRGGGIDDDLISANTVVRDENGAIVAQLLVSSNGYAYAFADSGADAYNFATPAALGEYHTVGLRLDYNARTTDFFLDDRLLGTLPFGESIQSCLFARPAVELVAVPTLDRELYSASLDDFSVHVAVPEPASAALGLLGVAVLLGIAARRRRTSASIPSLSGLHSTGVRGRFGLVRRIPF
jgi:MYXO-CTERM domain-containing protein